MKIFNNLTRVKEDFKTLEKGKVKFYSCGPTTYNFLHVGNARALVVGDLFHRIFKTLGYDVTFVRNFTDVDDKIIDEAKKLGVDPLELSARFVHECEVDMNSLGMLPATHTPKVSETMSEIIHMIEELLSNSSAYEVEGEILFDVEKFKTYGNLSKKKLEDLQAGARVQVDTKKKNPADFVLWKPAKVGEIFWESPWGKGRPGWHIECSAMAKKFLGKTIDLHHGGVDLMFPHHENEIAQSEAANKCTFSHCWAHHEFVNFASEKMSKSLGNVVTMRDFMKVYGGQVLRHILLSVHYRSRMEWSDEVVSNAIHEVQRIHEFVRDVQKAKVSDTAPNIPLKSIISAMKEHLENDFNIPACMAEFFTFLRDVRRDILSLPIIATANYKEILDVISFIQKSLGVIHENPEQVLQELQKLKQKNKKIEKEEIEKLVVERVQAKKDKNFKRSDEIRDYLKKNGVELQDRPDGTTDWE
ncbi:MAG: cysteine--tRNA ligase [Bacteriovoracaceae bacterium]|nr:cysteine--tRNA ligase [Bacteriovoracaceae bacterium]